MEKSVPRDHRLSLLGKPRNAKRRSSGRIILSHPHTHVRFLYYQYVLLCHILQHYFNLFDIENI